MACYNRTSDVIKRISLQVFLIGTIWDMLQGHGAPSGGSREGARGTHLHLIFGEKRRND